MVKCHSCGKNLGVFETKIKHAKDGQTYCPNCARHVLEEEGRERLGFTDVCNFQKPMFYEGKFVGYHCYLTESSSSFADGAISGMDTISQGCNPDKCPMYQTWKLLQSK